MVAGSDPRLPHCGHPEYCAAHHSFGEQFFKEQKPNSQGHQGF
jgi:hypothetical protein